MKSICVYEIARILNEILAGGQGMRNEEREDLGAGRRYAEQGIDNPEVEKFIYEQQNIYSDHS